MTHSARGVMALAVAVCATALSGCHADPVSTVPTTLSDPPGLSNDVQSLDTPLQASVFESMSAISGGTSPLARTTRLLAAMAPTRSGGGVLRESSTRKQAFAVKALRPSFATAPAGPGSLIPESYWGKVYVWSTSTQKYVEGSASGGPEDGVEFTLYALNPVSGLPAQPLNPIGFVDLTDHSNNTTYVLDVVVGDGTTTYADYFVSVTATESSIAATASGYVSDGTHRLDFSNSASASSSQAAVDFALGLNHPAVSAHLQASLAIGDPTSVLTITLSVTRGSEKVVLSGTLAATQAQSGASATANIAITVNGRDFASITGTVHSGSSGGYTYDGPERALTGPERDAVDHLLEAPSVLAAAVGPVFAPAEELVGSSYSLGLGN